MQLFSSPLVLYILLQPLLALALSPPDSLNITFPQNVTQGERVSFGFDFPESVGLSWAISIKNKAPDGSTDISSTTTSVDAIRGSLQKLPIQFPNSSVIACSPIPIFGAGGAAFNASQTGIYTLFWNVTYTLSSDPSQAANGSCGPPPYSSQNWILSQNITVGPATTSTINTLPPSATVVPFSSEPTGSIPSPPPSPTPSQHSGGTSSWVVSHWPAIAFAAFAAIAFELRY
ncbi:hypothetical protein SISSUDRAFT_1121046 [Sistotremastrum suecicum HHB10207 ss-3]|uniref:Uncharacterized protein n=1 Tax=Sistotremastrum suecicum HHB10207 ss-3 TaxID=1314776 RepID=A0A166BDN4_9AGAM|nr:hypothetical protein SISSUDRAFT_1121046 [Sistotremastrum suecicum HHB10207 ss-3]